MPACVTETLFHVRQPAPPLDLFVESVWLCKNDPRPRALERILPSGGAQLIVNLTEDETRAYSDSRWVLSAVAHPGAS
jgi:hypothetical protein